MRRKLCLGCSLLVHGFTNFLLVEILLSFYIYNSFMSQKTLFL